MPGYWLILSLSDCQARLKICVKLQISVESSCVLDHSVQLGELIQRMIHSQSRHHNCKKVFKQFSFVPLVLQKLNASPLKELMIH